MKRPRLQASGSEPGRLPAVSPRDPRELRDGRRSARPVVAAHARTEVRGLRTRAALAVQRVAQRAVEGPDAAEDVHVHVVRPALDTLIEGAAVMGTLLTVSKGGTGADGGDAAEEGAHEGGLLKLAHVFSVESSDAICGRSTSCSDEQ